MSAIAAIDPGGVTGIAWVQDPLVEEQHLHSQMDGRYGDIVEIDCRGSELQGAYEVVLELVDINQRYELNTIVVEDFVLSTFNMKRDLLSPVRITALVKAMCWYEWPDFLWPQLKWIMQPSSSMSVIDKPRMEALQLWTPGMKDGNAACAHLVSYLRKYRNAARSGR